MCNLQENVIKDKDLLNNVRNDFVNIERAAVIELKAHIILEEPLRKVTKEFETIRF